MTTAIVSNITGARRDPAIDPQQHANSNSFDDNLNDLARNFDEWTNSPPPSPSAAKHINWSLVYSSDEESERSRQATLMRRSNSDPSLMGSSSGSLSSMPIPRPSPTRSNAEEPHRRSRGMPSSGNTTSDDDEISLISDDDTGSGAEDEERRRPPRRPRTRDLGTWCRTVLRCTPVRGLLVLFLVSCYTTFWLPYPEIRPVRAQVLQQNQTAALPRVGLTRAMPSVLHAQAAPEMELSYRPELDRYYKQEGFSNHAWAKYANVWALGTVVAWAVREQHRQRRGEEATASSPSSASSTASSFLFLC